MAKPVFLSRNAWEDINAGKIGDSSVASLPQNDNSKKGSLADMRQYSVYILTNKSGTLYVGVTNNLERRMFEHKNSLNEGFTKKYKINRLMYYESFNDIDEAIYREKQIKGWRRDKKIALIEEDNPTWQDLSEDWFE
ncbi:MAG: GIY-YIG nuclease family protein [Thermodesulfobacteriota bacterium]